MKGSKEFKLVMLSILRAEVYMCIRLNYNVDERRQPTNWSRLSAVNSCGANID